MMSQERLVPAVDPAEFKFALGVCMAAASQKGPYTNPELYGFSDGEQRYQLTDNAMSRGSLAVIEQFKDREKSMSLMMRISGSVLV
ncbi:hypothetical protein [Hyphomicrobium sp. DY-1]|uniref:hypothetical protein n=1 Tax=Hyphomicrobium sp. DY-1 TaxID=3075650 RepID=UPI0039C2833C